MSDIAREVYSEAAGRAVTLHERLGLWTVYPYYEPREGTESYAVAPRNVPKEQVPPSDLRLVRRKVTYSPSVANPSGISRPSPEKAKAEKLVNLGHPYAPLKDHPELFDKFARLGDEGEIGREEWLAWLHTYGVLGVLPGRTGQYQRNETTDSFSRFVHEALLANQTLRMFEAVAADKDGPDVEAIRELLPEDVGDEPDQIERAALWAVEDTIKQKVHLDCYERLIPRDTGEWRKKRLSPFAKRWKFNSLLGAMWLQFSWLVTMDDLRYCERKGCNHHISPYARIDKTTCDATCRKRKSRKPDTA